MAELCAFLKTSVTVPVVRDPRTQSANPMIVVLDSTLIARQHTPSNKKAQQDSGEDYDRYFRILAPLRNGGAMTKASE